jgi:hypothetical protein
MFRALAPLLLLFAACSPAAQPSSSEPILERGRPAEFAFGVLDGSVVTHETTRGRVTALLFVTTFDLPSQAAARRLADVQSRHRPRFNAVAVAIESAENATLVVVFRDSLALPFPVAIADQVELRASPLFADVDRVPTLILLDREGRPTYRHHGLFEPSALESWLRGSES